MNNLILLLFTASLLAYQNASVKATHLPTRSSMAYSTGNNDQNRQEDEFTIIAPKGWEKFDTVLMGHHFTVLRSPLEKNDNFRENVNVASEPSGSMDLQDYFDANMSSMKSLPEFREISKEDKTINSIKFKNLKYSHNYGGTPIDVDAYFVVHNGKGYVITCSAARGELSQWQPVFDKIMSSFSFK